MLYFPASPHSDDALSLIFLGLLNKFPCRSARLEQLVQRLWRDVLGLGEAEPRPDNHANGQRSREEGGLALQITLFRIKHIWSDGRIDDV